MTLVTTQLEGYLDSPYATEGYLSGANAGNLGLQFTVVIDAVTPLGLQSTVGIADAYGTEGLEFEGVIATELAEGLQYQGIIDGATGAHGLQYQGVIDASLAQGLQYQGVIAASLDQGLQYQGVIAATRAVGLQFNVVIDAVAKTMGLQFRKDTGIVHLSDCGGEAGYLTDPYLEGAYLVATDCAHMGLQFAVTIATTHAEGLQFQAIIAATRALGLQYKGVIDTTRAHGLQFDSVRVNTSGLQFTVVLYNTDNLRILCDFPSRGLTGNNWTANSTAPGDFIARNLNTDIVEQVWRSNTGDITGVTLVCDTEIPQGVFLDTLAILGHNFTSSANLVLVGASDPLFASVGITITLPAASSLDPTNIYYIAPDFPLQGFRYWRLTIDDVSNGDNFLEAGTIIFGAATIFQGECFVDQIGFEFKDFADTVRTEGYTNVANSRALKKALHLDFRLLRFSLGNFRQLRAMFTRDRTVFKCLWIPTPDPTDQEYTSRFAVFGKLQRIPAESHNSKGASADYTDLSVDVDESL